MIEYVAILTPDPLRPVFHRMGRSSAGFPVVLFTGCGKPWRSYVPGDFRCANVARIRRVHAEAFGARPCTRCYPEETR